MWIRVSWETIAGTSFLLSFIFSVVIWSFHGWNPQNNPSSNFAWFSVCVSLALFLCLSQISLLHIAVLPWTQTDIVHPTKEVSQSRLHRFPEQQCQRRRRRSSQHWSPTHTPMHILTYSEKTTGHKLAFHLLPDPWEPKRCKEKGKILPGQWKTERMEDAERNGKQEQMEGVRGRNKRKNKQINKNYNMQL